MSSWQFNFTIASFPVGWSGNYNQFAAKMVSLMSAILVGNIMPGIYSQGVISLPTSDQGPVIMNGQLYIWNPGSGQYLLFNSTGVPYLRSDNVLDNGDFQIWQRTGDNYAAAVNIASLTTTTTVPSTQNNFQADRWYVVQDGTLGQAPTQQQIAAGPILGATDRPNTINALRITANATATTITANQFCYAAQRLSLRRARQLFDVTPSLSIWLRTSIIGTFCVFAQNAAATNSLILPCQISTPNQWTKFSFPATPMIPYSNGGYGTNPTDWSMTVGVVAACGSTYQQSPAMDSIWQSALRYADSNQTQLLQIGGATLDFTLAQFEPAPTVSAFQFKRFEDQLWECEWYYQKSYDYLVAPGTALSQIAGPVFMLDLTSAWVGSAPFKREMRIIPYALNNAATPVVTQGLLLWDPWSGNANKASQNNSNTSIGMIVSSGLPTVIGLTASSFSGFGSNAGVGGDGYSVMWSANAEL